MARIDTPMNVSATWERPLVSSEGGRTTLMLRITAAAADRTERRRAPIDLAFALDRSGSMSGEPLDLVREGVHVAVANLREEDRTALVVYDDMVDVLQPLAAATPRTKSSIRLALLGVDARGSTNLCAGWMTACAQIAEANATADPRPRLRRAMVLTDGLANVGETDPSALVRHATELRRRGISTTTLGVGLSFDETLLSSMAEAGGGNFQYIGHARDLPAFFRQELGELLSTVALGITVRLVLPRGTRAHLVSGFPIERRGKQITVSAGDLPAEDEIVLIFDVTTDACPQGAEITPELTIRWTDPEHDSRQQRTIGVAPVHAASPEVCAAAPVEREVQEQGALQRASAAQREAMRLDREGRFRESRQQHRFAASSLAAAPQSAKVAARLQEAIAFAEHDETVAFSEGMRKQAVHDAVRRFRGRREELDR